MVKMRVLPKEGNNSCGAPRTSSRGAGAGSKLACAVKASCGVAMNIRESKLYG